MTDNAARLTVLNNDELISMHERMDSADSAAAANLEAHHLVSVEMLRRGIPHGHDNDTWAQSAVLIEKAVVGSPEEIEAPTGMEKAWGETLADGGTVSIFLTVDGYVLKADPTVADVHVDAVMGGGRRKPRNAQQIQKTIKEENGRFTVYSEDMSRRFGTYDSLEEAEKRLSQIERFKKEDSLAIPAGVRSAAKQALKWIAEGRAGDGFTSAGRNRARQLADGGSVSRAVLVKMRAYFARHAVDKEAEGWGDNSNPTPGMVAWAAWGGDAGRAWANKVLEPVEKQAIPESITDIHINLQNRQHAIDEYLYGPMNPNAPGDYWQRLGEVWDVDAEEAASTRCGNCAAFNQKPEMLEAIAEGISEGGGAVADAADLGYCELFDFKCAAARSCTAWLVGGPLIKAFDTDNGSRAEKAREATATFTLPDGAVYRFSVPEGSENELTAISKHATHDQKTHGRRGGAAGNVDPQIAESIIERVRANGGLSVSMVDGSEPPGGFMVARVGVKAAIVEADDFYDADRGPAALSSFLKSNQKELTGGDYLGVWHDPNGGKVYLDVSENVENQSTAERLGSERNQLSIWDVVEGKEIPTGGTGELEKAKAFRGGQIAGSVEDDGRGDRRLRERDLRQTKQSVEKHQAGKHDQKLHGRWAGGASGGAGDNEFGGYTLNEPPNPPGEANRRGADSIAAAKEMRDRIGVLEPEITRDMITLANSNGARMAGLDQRLKSEKSLARKIDDEKDADFGGDAKLTAENMSDVARYTMTFKDNEYVQGTERILEDLKDQGYLVNPKNYWQDGDPYQGINISAVHPNGAKFELQVHTPTSLDFKEPTHERYDKYRESRDPKERYKEYTGMRRMARQVPKPPPPDELLSIGEIKFQPFTPTPDSPPVTI